MSSPTNAINKRNSRWWQRSVFDRCRASLAENQSVYGRSFSRHRALRQYAVYLFPIASRPL